ncbi:MAG: creatininase family protein [FCB group bacterium]|jgi:creatinine amidohydrolase|nr:creatininase family protein [FCB group bacterium]
MATGREVRYERLRPAQIVGAREAVPVVYIPIGTLEWHGEHNPIGLDTLKAHALACRCAERSGGLVFPGLYYGENREYALMETNAADRHMIHKKMGLPDENFAPGYMHTTHLEHALAYQRLLLHMLLQARSLGFKVIVFVAGHYPLIDHARAAASLFQQMPTRPHPIVWAFSGYELVRDLEMDVCGDHAGKWETSLMMALEPGLSDLSIIEGRGDPAIGATDNGVLESSAEFGERAIAAIVERVDITVHHLLDDFDGYQRHGAPLFPRVL